MSNQRPLVSVEWLAQHLFDENLGIVDGSWHLPTEKRDPYQEYLAGHIPGAVFFDIDRVSTPSDLPHMVPSAEMFAESAGTLGLSENKTVVVYDSKGLFSAARVWWMFRLFGFTDVRILDGGIPAWLDAGHSLAQGVPVIEKVSVTSTLKIGAVVDAAQVLQASEQRSAQILDARSRGRFNGTEPEPRAGLRGGHIPGSICLPFNELLDNGSLKPNDALREAFDHSGLTDESPVITSCGSGVTAAILTLALHCIGRDDTALYDGSWTEWGANAELPVDQAAV